MYVLFGVVAIGVLGSLVSFIGRGKLYDQIGRGGLSLNEDGPPRPEPGGAIYNAERDDEIRQMLTARNARHAASGREVVDVEEELSRLTAPAIDPALRDEIRALVIAKNRRRERQGLEPLDVEVETDRQVRELGG